jgi:hypothetical protein
VGGIWPAQAACAEGASNWKWETKRTKLRLKMGKGEEASFAEWTSTIRRPKGASAAERNVRSWAQGQYNRWIAGAHSSDDPGLGTPGEVGFTDDLNIEFHTAGSRLLSAVTTDSCWPGSASMSSETCKFFNWSIEQNGALRKLTFGDVFLTDPTAKEKLKQIVLDRWLASLKKKNPWLVPDAVANSSCRDQANHPSMIPFYFRKNGITFVAQDTDRGKSTLEVAIDWKTLAPFLRPAIAAGRP